MSTIGEMVEILIFNTPYRHALYLGMAREARDSAPTCEQVRDGIWTVEQAAVFNLADAVKDRVEMMIDYIVLDEDPNFPIGRAGHRDDPHDERSDIIQALARHAFEEVDWHEVARSVLARLADSER